MSPRETKTFDDEESIDLEDIIGGTVVAPPTSAEQATIKAVAERSHFPSREPVKKKVRKRSPYVIQKNVKMRIGMPELLAEISDQIDSTSDQETLEMAIGALLTQESLTDLLIKFNQLKGQ